MVLAALCSRYGWFENYRGCCPSIFLHVHQFLSSNFNNSIQFMLISSSTVVAFTVRLLSCKFHSTSTFKFQYLQIPALLPILPNSTTCKFHLRYVYCQIPVLANSTPVIFTAKCHYMQIPCHTITSIFQYLQLPPCYVYCQIPLLAISTPFTDKFHYLQIQRPQSRSLQRA